MTDKVRKFTTREDEPSLEERASWLNDKRFNCICGCSTLVIDEFDDSIGFSVIISPHTLFRKKLEAIITILKGEIYSLYDVLVDKQEYKDFIKSEYERLWRK